MILSETEMDGQPLALKSEPRQHYNHTENASPLPTESDGTVLRERQEKDEEKQRFLKRRSI